MYCLCQCFHTSLLMSQPPLISRTYKHGINSCNWYNYCQLVNPHVLTETLLHTNVQQCSSNTHQKSQMCFSFFRYALERITTSSSPSRAWFPLGKTEGWPTDRRQPTSRKKTPCEDKVYKKGRSKNTCDGENVCTRLTSTGPACLSALQRANGQSRRGAGQSPQRYELTVSPTVYIVSACQPLHWK